MAYISIFGSIAQMSSFFISGMFEKASLIGGGGKIWIITIYIGVVPFRLSLRRRETK